jgi:phosphoribosyl-ATP pyrophosphohydrolase/phosphoribosyl-AMP cyclohydrolase
MAGEAIWARLTPDAGGLVPAIVVDARDFRVLMLGWMNQAALAATLTTRRVTFFSRSRAQLWEKGETSGHRLDLVDLRVDCDADALLVRATPVGPTCHTGRGSCFFRPLDADGGWRPEDDGPGPEALALLERTIAARKAGQGATNAQGRSYVRELMDRGVEKINSKIAEEAAELCRALRSESDERVAEEMADLLFHALVGLSHREVPVAAVVEVLSRRMGTSGVDERASRGE